MATLIDASMADTPATAPTSSTHPYTCLACSLAFTTPTLQRNHYTTDLHRYNSKRRVAGLVPVTASVFNEKIVESLSRTGVAPNVLLTTSAGGVGPVGTDSSKSAVAAEQGRWCSACNKGFSSEGAESNHVSSRKHRDMVATYGEHGRPKPLHKDNPSQSNDVPSSTSQAQSVKGTQKSKADDQVLEALVALRLDAAPKITLLSCLFCSSSSFTTMDDKVKHMLTCHSFFIPDRDYLVQLDGLMEYLAESITVWNVCIYCGAGFGGKVEEGQSREDQATMTRKGMERVRQHMLDKSHCKMAWDTERQRLEFSDFYDFRASYSDAKNKNSSKSRKGKSNTFGADEGWEDVSDPGDVTTLDETSDVVMDESQDSDSESSLDEEEDEVAQGDSPFELVLPSGKRIGHRGLRHIYKQNLFPYAFGGDSTLDPSRNLSLVSRLALMSSESSSAGSLSLSETALMKRIQRAERTGRLSDGALVPRQGGLGAHGRGLEVVKARGKGEARDAGKSTREFREVRRREEFRTRVATTSGNQQKHYRDPLLQ